MTALSGGRNTPRRTAQQFARPVAASTTIYAGGMVTALAAGGYLVPAGTASAGVCIGVAEETVANSGAAGDASCQYSRGTYRFANSASGDLITGADIGNTCFIVDDQTVAKTDNSAARKAAGKIVDVDASGVWVQI